MKFIDAWQEAAAIVLLIALLPVVPLVLRMSRNVTNPEFDMLVAFETGMLFITDAILPVFGATLVLALTIYASVSASSTFSGR